MIIVLVLLLDPGVLDFWERGTSIATRVAIRYWLRRPGLGVEDTWVREVEEAVFERWCSIPCAESVTGVGCDLAEDVGTDVPAAEGVQVPVSLDGGEFGVVIVEVGVGCADQMLGDGVTEENREDAVLDGVGFVLVEGDEDESVLHEVGVIQERGEKVVQPFTCNCDGGVMTVGGHVGGWYLVSIVSRGVSRDLCLLMNIHWGSLLALRSS